MVSSIGLYHHPKQGSFLKVIEYRRSNHNLQPILSLDVGKSSPEIDRQNVFLVCYSVNKALVRIEEEHEEQVWSSR